MAVSLDQILTTTRGTLASLAARRSELEQLAANTPGPVAFRSRFPAATVGLIALYSGSVLRSLARAGAIGAGLAGLYLYLYVLLQLEDYALLLGSLGLFALLAAAMALTRRVDWYAAGR